MADNRNHELKAVVLGLGSVIGGYVANRLMQDGWSVIGSAREETVLDEGFTQVVRCNLGDSKSIERAGDDLRVLSDGWSLLFVAAGTMQPIGRFFELDATEWERGFQVNTFGPLRLLRAIWSVRSSTSIPTVCFLAGGGTNNDFPNYSAYCASKIMLIKMVELLQSEEPSTKFVIIGPGYVRTPIHGETMSAGDAAGINRERTAQLIEGPGTDLEVIYRHVHACHEGLTAKLGGRNFSTVHDGWENEAIVETINLCPKDAYRLRRFPYQSGN